MLSKTRALERCAKIIESKCDRHGYLLPSELRDALLDLAEELSAEPDDEAPPPLPPA